MTLDRAVFMRKVLHVVFCLGLAAPYLSGFEEYSLYYFAVLALAASYANAVMIKRPLLAYDIKNALRERRRRILLSLLRGAPTAIRREFTDLEQRLESLEDLIEEQIRRMERAYERVGGYIGVTHGILGVLVSQILFGDRTLYGIMALAVVDPVGAVVGSALGRTRIPLTDATLEGFVAEVAAFAVALVVLGVDPIRALAVSLAAGLSEVLFVEDNLVIPVASSLAAYYLALP